MNILKLNIFFCFLLSFILVSCIETNEDDISNEPTAKEIEQKKKDSLEKIRKSYENFAEIKYKRLPINSAEERSQMLKDYANTPENKNRNKALRTLNRKELGYVRVGDTIIVPETIAEDMIEYSIFPRYYEGARDLPKIIMVSNRWQSYACYEYGKLVRFAAANTGKERTPTFGGRYALVWKQRLRKSSVNEFWILPFTWNFHRFAGNAFHKFEMPGYPASHSCIRQFMDDAEWLFNWGKGALYDSQKVPIHLSGTPVIIIDNYDYSRGRKGEWFNLSSNKDNIVILPEKPMEVEEAYIPIQQIPKEVRGILPNRQRYVYAEDTLRARGVIRENVKLTPSINYNVLRKQRALLKKKKDSIAQSSVN